VQGYSCYVYTLCSRMLKERSFPFRSSFVAAGRLCGSRWAVPLCAWLKRRSWSRLITTSPAPVSSSQGTNQPSRGSAAGNTTLLRGEKNRAQRVLSFLGPPGCQCLQALGLCYSQMIVMKIKDGTADGRAVYGKDCTADIEVLII